MVEAIQFGTIIEEYPSEQRVLICGPTTILHHNVIHLHVVCEYAGAETEYIEFVTAYIPDEEIWERPNFVRRKTKKR